MKSGDNTIMDNILIVHSRDNVGIALRAITKGQYVVAGGKEIFFTVDEIPVSHKVALQDIDAGEEIIKYGEPIALSTKRISKGQWIHTHNLESKIWKK